MVAFFVDAYRSKSGTQTERDVLGFVGFWLAIIFGGGFIALLLKSILS